MPVYEYRCRQCGRRLSVWWRTFSDAETGTARCPHCGAEDVTRRVSGLLQTVEAPGQHPGAARGRAGTYYAASGGGPFFMMVGPSSR